MQNTNLRMLLRSIVDYILGQVRGSWRSKSLFIICLLSGFYLTNNFISYFLDKSLNSVFIVFLLVIASEILIRFRHLRPYLLDNLYLNLLNNIRIGATYALVLEAFKLGS